MRVVLYELFYEKFRNTVAYKSIVAKERYNTLPMDGKFPTVCLPWNQMCAVRVFNLLQMLSTQICITITALQIPVYEEYCPLRCKMLSTFRRKVVPLSLGSKHPASSLIAVCFFWLLRLHFNPENGGNNVLRNVCEDLTEQYLLSKCGSQPPGKTGFAELYKNLKRNFIQAKLVRSICAFGKCGGSQWIAIQVTVLDIALMNPSYINRLSMGVACMYVLLQRVSVLQSLKTYGVCYQK
jgi:hypothetical protein